MTTRQIPEALAGLKPPDSTSLSDQIYASLRRALISGEIVPGTRMVEGVISQQLGVSTTPVREALIRLTVEGWLETRRNRGFLVADIHPREIEERYQLREILECRAAREAALRMGEEQIDRLERICDEADNALDNDHVAEYARLDAELHETILAAMGNETLLSIWRQHLDPARHAGFAAGMKEHRRFLIGQHRHIVAAIRGRDPGDAAESLREHLEYARRAYLNRDVPSGGAQSE